nr:hypothetical protein [Neobacillus sp. Marseille-Q6967]
MKKVLIALFVALVLFVASGGLDRFATVNEDQTNGQVENDGQTIHIGL